jgi:membrane-associated phospholipid phosphatase
VGGGSSRGWRARIERNRSHLLARLTALGRAPAGLLARPEAGNTEHVAVASLGALLAGFTGNLRIRADQHFPTDALVGSLIGTASGVSVPMLHQYLLHDGRRAPHPRGHAWLMSAGGYVVGAALGVGLSTLVY